MNKNLAREAIVVEQFNSAIDLRNATVNKHCDRIAKEILRILEVWKGLKEKDLDLPDFDTYYEVDGRKVNIDPVVSGEEGARIIQWVHFCSCFKGGTYLKETPQGWRFMRVPQDGEEDEEVFTVKELLKYSVPRIRHAWHEWLNREVGKKEAEAQAALEAL